MPLSIKNLLLKNTQNKFVRRKGYLYCTNKCLRVLDGLVFRRLNFLISLHPRLFHFFQFLKFTSIFGSVRISWCHF